MSDPRPLAASHRQAIAKPRAAADCAGNDACALTAAPPIEDSRHLIAAAAGPAPMLELAECVLCFRQRTG